ncbi:hypothetical protein HDU76_011235 [Blyttiomyces sp. JEL0837]|nr:hypothetical protein HDU76_011235 [Blyttiomyces sp. JEL0837]
MSSISDILSVYLVTDSRLLPPGVTLAESVAKAIEGGVSIVQLREKSLDTAGFVKLARELQQICKKANVPFLINDRVDVALAIDADGVHIGQDDMPLTTARRLLGSSKIIGVTVETPAQAVQAAIDGADYIGTSAVYPTTTKVHPRGIAALGHDGVADILAAVAQWEDSNTDSELQPARRIPVITIGGINATNVEQLVIATTEKTLSIRGDKTPKILAGVAVVSAIIAEQDSKTAAEKLKTQFTSGLTSAKALAASASLEASSLALRMFSRLSISDASNNLCDRVVAAFEKVRSNKPLVHNITNFVVMTMSADIILHAGGSPLMAHSVQEVENIVAFISSLVINIGTLSDPWIEGMHKAAAKANERNVPIVLDPVGGGATPYRMKTTMDLLTKHRIAIVKGNAGEIGSILGSSEVASRGVDSAGELKEPHLVAKKASLLLNGTTVCISGKDDFISDGTRVVKCSNGNGMLGTITGTGCSTTALIGCFAGVESDPVVAAVGGTVLMGVAAELAMASGDVRGASSFRIALFDAIFNMDASTLRKLMRVTVL